MAAFSLSHASTQVIYVHVHAGTSRSASTSTLLVCSESFVKDEFHLHVGLKCKSIERSDL